MNAIEHYTRLFAYDDWANREVLVNLRAAHAPSPQVLRFIAHILSAQRLWLERLTGREQSLPVWPEFTLEQCEAQAADLALLWKNYLQAKREEDLAESIIYRNSKGESWSSRKDDVLMHVIMHSTHHRGQIASALRAAGLAPAYTDYIHGVRQGFVK
jgi:uncharacterized damage-inducible protein DinB